MRPQLQTTFGGADASPDERGNCYAVCIASLLGVDASHVPNFISADQWFEETSAWLAERGLALMSFEENPVRHVPEWKERVTMIAGGPGPRGHDHAVLWKGDKVIHDPHPSGDGLSGKPTSYEVLVVIDPDALRCWINEANAINSRDR